MLSAPNEYAERLREAADHRRKVERERGIRNPLVEAWMAAQVALAEQHGRCERTLGAAACILPAGHGGGHFLRVD